ncbi:MAG: PEP-CTERM sorting domain-containing protein [Akkermansiaceae bacterium]|nr:PEP-CTERM sorting domain-containing protein [Akkermansiaceae bacterium]
MKKSIIALALLSSAALAAEIPTTTNITNYTGTTNGTASWTDSEVSSPLYTWALTFTVTVKTADSSSKPLISMTAANSGASGLSVVSTDGSYTTLAIGNDATTTLSDSSIAVTDGATYTLAYDASTYTVYLGSSDGNYITYTFDSSSTVTTTLTSTVLRQWTNGGNVSTTITSVADLSSVSGDSAAFASYVTTGSVPEPATATLGLLALGALALRRRRA